MDQTDTELKKNASQAQTVLLNTDLIFAEADSQQNLRLLSGVRRGRHEGPYS